MSTEATGAEPQSIGRLGLVGVAALGVVFGDIGTSPLYTLKTVLDYTGPHPDPAATLGALSLILWTLVPHHDGQVRQYRHAHRQRRRGRHHRADDPARRQAASAASDYRGRPVRRGAHLRRWRDYACDFGALGARRGGADRAEFADLCAARGDCDPARAVCGAAIWDGQDRPRVRPDHAALVCGDRGAGRLWRPAAPVGLCGRRSAIRPRLSVAGRIARDSWSSAAYFFASPGPRRCTQTWDISGQSRSVCPGS